jgi:NTE family protein
VRLAELWRQLRGLEGCSAARSPERVGRAVRTQTHLHGRGPLRQMLAEHLPVERIEDLKVPFQCVAAAVERAARALVSRWGRCRTR